MGATTWTTPLAVTSFAIVLAGELWLLKGVYDWAGLRSDVAVQLLQRDRVLVYLAALLVAAGAAGFALTGERGPALAVLATAVASVLLTMPGPDHVVAFYPCLVIVPVGAAMALRTMLAPWTPVTLMSTLTFFVIAVAGGYLLRGLVAAAPVVYSGSEEQAHLIAYGRLVCGLAGAALLSAPLLWLLTGHRWLAALSAPFLLVVVTALFDRPDVLGHLGYLTYAITGPMAMGAAIYALFTDG
ncbi:hypothetical protein [Actinomadura livida]|uniref:Uncharacterized protein n=1 Tax=Actinomadura livida TaxID=79909 RepID=A0A7W7N0V7_9ACTN|nr:MULTISPECIES: hypothetical protein [Actinomadura]MBB4777514.1 hypothetical protein [Actinomadura catellatispora]